MNKIICESPLFNSLFKCPLCNDLIHSATVINECLHRFCKSCIINYFESNTNKTCPVCQIILINPLQTLKSDLTYQRLLYKIFHRELVCKLSLESISMQIETIVHVSLEHWNIALDLFAMHSSIGLSTCYLECPVNTSLSSIEKFLRIKHSIPSTLKVEFFYQSFLLNSTNERLIDLCNCFDIITPNSSLDIRFLISPVGYKALLKHLRLAKPLQMEVTTSIDSSLKMKICRSQSSQNDWFIPQSTLPDLINSQTVSKRKPKSPRRRVHFLPTMVKVPPSIFDYLSPDTNKRTFFSQKTICKVPPYIPENSVIDSTPLDLRIKCE